MSIQFSLCCLFNFCLFLISSFYYYSCWWYSLLNKLVGRFLALFFLFMTDISKESSYHSILIFGLAWNWCRHCCWYSLLCWGLCRCWEWLCRFCVFWHNRQPSDPICLLLDSFRRLTRYCHSRVLWNNWPCNNFLFITLTLSTKQIINGTRLFMNLNLGYLRPFICRNSNYGFNIFCLRICL